MKWSEIKKRFPKKFILMSDIKEERLSEDCFRVIGGKVLLTSDKPDKILKAYKEYKKYGKNVLYSLPGTPDDFIVEEKALLGVF